MIKFDHPNIVKSFCWFKELMTIKRNDNTIKCICYNLVMEYEKGGDLLQNLLDSTKSYTNEVTEMCVKFLFLFTRI